MFCCSNYILPIWVFLNSHQHIKSIQNIALYSWFGLTLILVLLYLKSIFYAWKFLNSLFNNVKICLTTCINFEKLFGVLHLLGEALTCGVHLYVRGRCSKSGGLNNFTYLFLCMDLLFIYFSPFFIYIDLSIHQ